MSKRSRRRADEGAPRFIALHHWITKSPAWCALSPNGKALLIDVWERHNGFNNGEIVYGVREAEKIGMAKSVTARAFEELVELGFLRIATDSSFDLKTKEARTWAITAEKVNGLPATKDFMRWHPENKTQSPERDRQSRVGDRWSRVGDNTPVSVPQTGPSPRPDAADQSPSRDTSIVPCTSPARESASDTSRGSKRRERAIRARVARGPKKPARFGDEAKAERIARRPPAAPPKPQWQQWMADEEEARRDAAALANACVIEGAPATTPVASNDTGGNDGKMAPPVGDFDWTNARKLRRLMWGR